MLNEITKRYRQAETLYRQALTDMHFLLPPNHSCFGKPELNLGKALWHEHQYADASLPCRQHFPF